LLFFASGNLNALLLVSDFFLPFDSVVEDSFDRFLRYHNNPPTPTTKAANTAVCDAASEAEPDFFLQKIQIKKHQVINKGTS
jgi:hypothetical protein